MSLIISWDSSQNRRAEDGGDLVGTQTNEIVIDAVTSVDYAWSGIQTHRPVEASAPTSDHYRRNLEVVSINCIQTDTPSTRSSDITVQPVETRQGVSVLMGVLKADVVEQRSVSAMALFRDLIELGAEVTISGSAVRVPLTGFRLLNVSVPTRAGMDGAAEFTLSFEELRRVEIEQVDTPTPRLERGRNRQDRGAATQQNNGTTPSPSADAATRSSAAEIVDSRGWGRNALRAIRGGGRQDQAQGSR